jgi:subtilisin family serine protease
VINLSLGLTQFCHTIEHELAAAAGAGVIIVAAAGNDNTDDPAYFPASDPRAFSIAALDSLDVKASFSNFHETVDVSAPGDGILAPFADGQWAVGAGTSFAAPFVSGQAALIRSVVAFPPDAQTWDPIRQGVVPIDDIPGNEAFRGLLGTGRFDGQETLDVLLSTSNAPESAGELRLTAAPNPSLISQTVWVAWDSPRAPRSATIHDVAGRWVGDATLRDGRLEWDGSSRAGGRAATGLYYVRIQPEAGSPAHVRLVRIGD